MTGLVRKATLLGVCGLLAATAAFANVPDPTNSTVVITGTTPATPAGYLWLVGTTNAGAGVDSWGTVTVTVKDAFNNAISGATVTIDLSGCCDLNLCSSAAGHSCAARTVTGTTNVSGQFVTHIIGAAKDPGAVTLYGGCGAGGVHIYANGGTGNVDLRPAGYTGISLDQNGAAGGSNGTTGTDVSTIINLVGQTFGNPSLYKGRGDLNADGQISALDISNEIFQAGRVFGIAGSGCTPGNYACGKPACP